MQWSRQTDTSALQGPFNTIFMPHCKPERTSVKNIFMQFVRFIDEFEIVHNCR